jgi:very-short-patch-repair endonuclease
MLRKKATQPERILWRPLRNRNFAGYKFRRQHPFEDYVLDFHCPTARLAIELDGGGHNHRAGQICDRTRSEFSRAMESLCCDSGIIRFAENSIASCEQSGSHSGSDNKTNPHLDPLPLEKGEAKSNRRSIADVLLGLGRHEATRVFRWYVRDTRHLSASPRLRGED